MADKIGMPRIARINISSLLYHVICRFVDGRFEFDTQLRHDYLCRLGLALRTTDWRLIAYALMDSHIHLAMIRGTQAFSQWIHPLNTGFAQVVNRKRRESGKWTLGPVFAERPTSKVYDRNVAINLISYLHNNPGRAGIVGNPAFSHWTSHRCYLDLQKTPPFLDVNLGLHLCGLGYQSLK
jgi:putative transposase